jgi:hypothetical protein
VNADPTIVQPDEMLTLSGEQVAKWGQVGVVKMGDPCDPIPSVYASDYRCGGEIETGGDFRFSVDEAEQYAARILNAVCWQRARYAEQRATELNEMATGGAATHDWRPRSDTDRVAACVRCRTVAYSDELLVAGAVPDCGTKCPRQWHEISVALSGEEGDAVCIFCKSSYTATHLYVLMDANGRYSKGGSFLTFDQAAHISHVMELRFVPVKLTRDMAIAAVAQATDEVDR